tara:strand:+ start:123 stop:311 length:189 start_codon:yes stop_codon:yes gene_type:complete
VPETYILKPSLAIQQRQVIDVDPINVLPSLIASKCAKLMQILELIELILVSQSAKPIHVEAY